MKEYKKDKLTFASIEFGDEAMALSNGFKGEITGKVEYMFEEPQVLIENLDSTGRPIQQWVPLSGVRVYVSDTILETRFEQLTGEEVNMTFEEWEKLEIERRKALIKASFEASKK